MDGGRTGARSITDRSDLNRRYDANLFLPNPLFSQPRTPTSPSGVVVWVVRICMVVAPHQLGWAQRMHEGYGDDLLDDRETRRRVRVGDI